jgi:hypothetical protein
MVYTFTNGKKGRKAMTDSVVRRNVNDLKKRAMNMPGCDEDTFTNKLRRVVVDRTGIVDRN